MEQDYWVLPLKDGTEIKIPPDKIKDINIRLENKQPIKAENRTVLWQDIAGGPYKYAPLSASPSLVEQAASAFNEPILTDDNEVLCVWVKEEVSIDRWNKYYAHFAGYQKLTNFGDRVVLAYRLPAHQLSPGNPQIVEKCTGDEINFLQSRLGT